MSRIEKAFIHLHHFASSDANRTNIGSICIERISKDTMRAVATNGHIMALVEWTTDWPEEWPEGRQFYIDVNTAKGILIARKQYEWTTIEGSSFAEQTSFPDYRHVIPKGSPTPVKRMSFDAHYFDLIRKFMDKIDPPRRNQFPKQGITVHTYGELEPTLIEPNVPVPAFTKVMFILMPLRA